MNESLAKQLHDLINYAKLNLENNNKELIEKDQKTDKSRIENEKV